MTYRSLPSILRQRPLRGLAPALCFLCGHLGAADPMLISTPAVALYGEPFTWKVTGLKPGEEVRVKASATDARRVPWTSEATYRADGAGTVDLPNSPALAGSYTGVDAFGLLWSMQSAQAAKKPAPFREDGVNGWTVQLSATSMSGATAKTTFRCVWQRPGEGLVREPLEQDGLRGFLYHPDKPGRFPGIIVLGGSEGGLFEPRARALASHGYAVLTLAYFNYTGLPDELVEVPLEYFDKAAKWMGSHGRVIPGGLGLMGGSKGGEATLLVASRNPIFRAVAAMTPADHVWEGNSHAFGSPDYKPASSWTWAGQPLPFIRYQLTPEEITKYQKMELTSWLPFFREALARADPGTLDRSAIPVERIQGGVLLVSGSDDQAWPAREACERVVARLKGAHFRHEVRHINIEGGGHMSCLPALITAGRGTLLPNESPTGGSPRADANGGYRCWAELLAFFGRHLGR